MQSPILVLNVKQSHQPTFRHVNSMPKDNPNRRQTRAANANAHPGHIVKDVLGVRRKQEEVDKEKKSQEERREARKARKVEEQIAIKVIADFENQMALDDRVQETRFPRHQTEGVFEVLVPSLDIHNFIPS